MAVPLLKTVPLAWSARDRTPLGLKTAPPAAARSRWLWEGRKNAGIVQKEAVPALHREAERDATGSNSRQHLVHTWIEQSVQGKRRGTATVIFNHGKHIKMSLTLWFYCG